ARAPAAGGRVGAPRARRPTRDPREVRARLRAGVGGNAAAGSGPGVVPPARFCSACGAGLPAPPPVTCARCGAEHWRNGAACANAIVARSDGRILLTRRALGPWRGLWWAPGGVSEQREAGGGRARSAAHAG